MDVRLFLDVKHVGSEEADKVRDGAGINDNGGVVSGARGDVYIVSSRISAGVYAPYDFCVSV